MRDLVKWEFTYKGKKYSNFVEVEVLTSDRMQLIAQNMVETLRDLERVENGK